MGWGVGGRKVQEGGDKCIVMADSYCKAETLGQEDPLEEEMATNSLMDRGAWQATVMGCKESDMTE